jgi:tight adherence protein C
LDAQDHRLEILIMSIIVIIGSTFIAASLGYFTYFLVTNPAAANASVKANLERGFNGSEHVAAARSPFLVRLGRALTPASYVRRLDRLLALAGRPTSMPLDRLLAAKPAIGLAGLGFGLILGFNGSPVLRLLGLVMTVFGYFLPDLLLLSNGQKRQKDIQLELANTLDQMLISVEAGLGFEGAVARAGENGKGPLAEELIRTLQDMQVGRSRREAYIALTERTNVAELRSFVQAVVQADAYGIAISSVLRVQAKVMRVKRRQRAEEKAMKLPVMILFPLLFFIFPVLFIAILGPTVINVIGTFSGG